MTQMVRSARGKMVDFDLLRIKAQLQSVPPPRHVEERKRAMDAKDGIKTDQQPDLDFLKVATDAVTQSAEAGKEAKSTKPKQASQLQRK